MSPHPHSWMYRYILLYFVSFLVGRGAHEWAVSHGIPPCPSEKMATSEFCCKYSSSKKLLNNNLWKGCINLCGCIRLRLFFHTQSSVCLHTRGTSERWSWQKKWTQDIIRERKDDNQVKLWVRCYQLKWHGVKCILSQLHYISQNGPTSLCWFCVRQSEHTPYFLLL